MENQAPLKDARTQTHTHRGQTPQAAPPSHAGNSHPVDGLRPPTPTIHLIIQTHIMLIIHFIHILHLCILYRSRTL